ncbi:MAG TPA: sigma 54-interacting transcriptional regulator [Leptospiraceae bacterium]|nr:sigma 54-interacting transcriptional regulator [Leptospiraceae bacterium]HNF15930.1 sigma 54-interacting transcriptional regulator [Leptospiraceae bacterium]HNF22971.1 sigma 54-interacting transcriptional regulator [Leptospiraceae bacterium]HNI96736.1 sigma 54-interacting transcriptional regulator [Leptospiraceae bacterium]HNM04821.1 sigma 54-interacting transcriptional regulator [Leptospiraceae bacterium]
MKDPVLGESPQAKKIRDKISLLKGRKFDLLLSGENGTGRDTAADFLSSANSELPLFKIDCRDWRNDFDFRISSGKFKGKEAAFEENFYFDRLDDLSSEGQGFLLRLIEERTARYSEKYNIKLYGQIFFSASEGLSELVKKKKFRDDLFSRISAVRISLVPIRERRQDIPLYVNLFLEELSKKHKKKIARLDPGLSDFISGHSWLGNLTELKAALEALVLFSKNGKLDKKYLTKNILDIQTRGLDSLNIVPGITLAEYEKAVILENLKHFGQNRALAAKALGISERNLYRKIKGMDSRQF